MMGPREFLKTYAPTFCWVTWFDLLIMYEQINEDANESSFRTSLYSLAKKGLFDTKPLGQKKQGGHGLMFLRKATP